MSFAGTILANYQGWRKPEKRHWSWLSYLHSKDKKQEYNSLFFSFSSFPLCIFPPKHKAADEFNERLHLKVLQSFVPVIDKSCVKQLTLSRARKVKNLGNSLCEIKH